MAKLNLTELDFDLIKNNFIEYLKNQDVLKDADYTGSTLNILLDVLAYNTHYNGYYLNMLANEMFLDTASKRSSVVSKAKMLGYVPASTRSCYSIVDISIVGFSGSSLYIPKFTKFLSENINNKYYTFVTVNDYYQETSNGNISLTGVELVEGEPVTTRKIYNKRENPSAVFVITDDSVDLNHLQVSVQKSTTDLTLTVYNKATNLGSIGPDSLVYFIEENADGFYQISFGDGILGSKLQNGNVVLLTYIVSSGRNSVGAKTFKLVDTLNSSYTSLTITTVNAASGGQAKESIDSIKFSAPKYYASQGRAVTYQDYVFALKNNAYNFAFDVINVWGGQDNNPPVYGQCFICAKPTGAYFLTNAQKKIIKEQILRPISVVTVEPEIVDPDYDYFRIKTEVLYDPKKTLLTQSELTTKIRKAILSFCNTNLNTFDSTFSFPSLMMAIEDTDPSILSNDTKINLEKKFLPSLTTSQSYTLDFGVSLQRGGLYSGITSNPGMQFYNAYTEVLDTIDDAYLEELPTLIGGLTEINVLYQGLSYTSAPTVTIVGDGTGAAATAVIVDGKLDSFIINSPGVNYTYAVVELSGGGGTGAEASAVVQGRYGNLRLVYYQNNIKKVYKENVGVVDYDTGIITLNDFNPYNVKNSFKKLSVIATPKSNIITSTKSKLLTIDIYDPTAISVTVKQKV